MFSPAYYQGFGAILFFILIVAFFGIYAVIYSNLGDRVNRTDILNARLVSFLPVFGLIYFINIIVPAGTQVIDVLEAFFDGYFLSLFFVLLLVNMGGPKQVLKFLDESQKPFKPLCLNMGSDARKFLHTCIWYESLS